MKKTFSFVWFLAATSSIILSSIASGANVTWDGGAGGTGTDIGTAVNWAGDVLPSVATPDTAVWDNVVTGNLVLTYTGTGFSGAAGNAGGNLSLTANQIGSVSIDSGTNTSSARFNNVTLASGAGALTLGDGANTFNITLGGVSGQTHTWTNDAANSVTVNSDVVFGLGGSGAHTLALGGAGNFVFNNSISFPTLTVTKAGAGTATFNGATVSLANVTATAGTFVFNDTSATVPTMTLNGGTIDLKKDVGLTGTAIVNGTGGTISASGGGKLLLNVAAGDFGVANGGTLTVNAVIANGSQSAIDFLEHSFGHRHCRPDR
ncbi:MAG: hypothetical protein QM755_09505 [Luteolibacter sp.]